MEELLRINQLWERILRKEADPVTQILYKFEFCEFLLKEFSDYEGVDLEEFAKDELLYTHLIQINRITQINTGFYEKLLPLIPLDENGDPFVDKTQNLKERNKELSAVLQQRTEQLGNIIKSKEDLEKFENDLQNLTDFIQAFNVLKEHINDEFNHSIQALNILKPKAIEKETAIGISIVASELFGKKKKVIIPAGRKISVVSENQVVKYIKLFNEANLNKLTLKLQFEGHNCIEIPLKSIFPETKKTTASVSYAFVENYLQLAIGNDEQNIESRRVLNFEESNESIIKQILNYGSKEH